MGRWQDDPVVESQPLQPWQLDPVVDEPTGATVGEFNMAPRTDATVSPGRKPRGKLNTKSKEDRDLIDRIMDFGPTVMGVIDQGVRGAAEGVANVFGLPGDIAKAVSGAKGPVTPVAGIPFPTSDTLKAVPNVLNDVTADLIGAERPRRAPENFGERIAHRVGEEIGAASVPVGGALTTAGRVGAAGARAAAPESVGKFMGAGVVDFIRQLPARMVESAAVKPGRFVRREGVTAGAAGSAAGAAGEATGRNMAIAQGEEPTIGQQVADIGTALGGAAAGGLVSGGVGLIGRGVGAATGNSRTATRIAEEVATDDIIRAAGLAPDVRTGVINADPLVEQIMQRPGVDAIPGYQPSLSDVTRHPNIAALEATRAKQGPNSGQYGVRRDQNVEAIDEAMERFAPQGKPGAFRDRLEIERNAQTAAASAQARDAEDAAAAAVQPLTPRTDRVERGNTLRGELDTARDVVRGATADAYAQADISGVPLAPTTLAEAIDRTTAGLTPTRRSLAPQDLLRQHAEIPAGTEMTVETAADLRTRLLELQRAARGPENRTTRDVLGRYIEAVEDVIGQAVTPEQRSALTAARQARHAEAEAFERRGDPVRDILADNPGGMPKMRDENVARLSARDDVAARLLEAADTPATRQAIRDELLSNADTSTAAGLHAFQQRYARQIARFPGLNDELGNAIQARVRETTARGAEGDLIRRLGSADGTVPGRSTVAEYLRFGNENAEKALRTVMRSNDPAKAADELLTFVNDDKTAVEGARKVFWDLLKKDTKSADPAKRTSNGVQPYLPAQLKEFLDDPAKGAVAARLFRDDPEHLENIRKVADSMQYTGAHVRPAAPQAAGRGLNVLPSTETIASRVFAVKRGVVSPAFAALNIGAVMARRAVSKNQHALIDKIMDKALLDPDYAVELLGRNNPANRSALARRSKAFLGNEVGTLMRMAQPSADRDDEELKAAVMR